MKKFTFYSIVNIIIALSILSAPAFAEQSEYTDDRQEQGFNNELQESNPDDLTKLKKMMAIDSYCESGDGQSMCLCGGGCWGDDSNCGCY
jgi:hypothetical protein